MTQDALIVRELRADTNWLYLDVEHRSHHDVDSHPASAAELALLHDGCAVQAARVPRPSGQVWRNWAAPSTLTLPLAALPDGELELQLSAFHESFTLPIVKQGRSVRYLPFEQSKLYFYHPGDPARGLEPVAGLEVPDCPGEVRP